MINPLAPLTATEIEKAVEIFRREHGDERAVFCSSGLDEPAKADVKAGRAVPRIVKFLGTDSVPDGGFEAYVNLAEDKVERLIRLGDDAQAPYGYYDLGLAVQLTLSLIHI